MLGRLLSRCHSLHFDLEGCIDEADDSINPLHLAWQAHEHNIKTSLALVWLLDCSGALL